MMRSVVSTLRRAGGFAVSFPRRGMASLADFSAPTLDGGEDSLAEFESSRFVLIENIASL